MCASKRNLFSFDEKSVALHPILNFIITSRYLTTWLSIYEESLCCGCWELWEELWEEMKWYPGLVPKRSSPGLIISLDISRLLLLCEVWLLNKPPTGKFQALNNSTWFCRKASILADTSWRKYFILSLFSIR